MKFLFKEFLSTCSCHCKEDFTKKKKERKKDLVHKELRRQSANTLVAVISIKAEICRDERRKNSGKNSGKAFELGGCLSPPRIWGSDTAVR